DHPHRQEWPALVRGRAKLRPRPTSPAALCMSGQHEQVEGGIADGIYFLIPPAPGRAGSIHCMNDAIGTSHSGEGRQARPQTGTPPRFWWLKRLGLMSGVVILLMIGTYWATGVWADRRLDDVLEEWARLPVIQPDDTLGTPA